MAVLLRPALDSLYASYDHAESALDPIQIVRRYERVDDREIVAAHALYWYVVAAVFSAVWLIVYVTK